MKCGTGLGGHCDVNHRYVCRNGPVFSLAELTGRPDALDGPGALTASTSVPMRADARGGRGT
jgi:hypothetical protein